MLEHLNGNELFLLSSFFFFGAGIFGWLSDGVVHDLGFGILGNTALSMIGAVGAVILLDRFGPMLAALLTIRVEPAVLLVGTSAGGATLVLLLALAAKNLVFR
ncbi:MAG: hypothetical protein C0606_05015 [Hyphomicrobiales bacterium]|nr:MAG: hypothetical protein C0606_05015 [Hyphomicrobiales bacterium]